MPDFTVTISEEGLKAMEAADGGGCYSFQDWIQNAASEKERRSVDLLIERYTRLNFRKVSRIDKEAKIKKMVLETAKERTDRMEEELKESKDGSI